MNLLIDNGKFSDDQVAAFKKYEALAQRGDLNMTSFVATEELGLTRQEHMFLQKHADKIRAQIKGVPAAKPADAGSIVTRDDVKDEQRRGGPQVSPAAQEAAYKDSVKDEAKKADTTDAAPIKEDKKVVEAIKDPA